MVESRFVLPFDGQFRITSPFGKRKRPLPGASENHQGLDYAMPVGTPVKAVAAGVVDFVGRSGGYGLQVRIRHDDGTMSWYSHLGKAEGLKKGMAVSQGDIVALSGGAKKDPNAGTSTGPHLDFRITDAGGRFVDPQKILSGGPATAPAPAPVPNLFENFASAPASDVPSLFGDPFQGGLSMKLDGQSGWAMPETEDESGLFNSLEGYDEDMRGRMARLMGQVEDAEKQQKQSRQLFGQYPDYFDERILRLIDEA
jgi:hypothetical protein